MYIKPFSHLKMCFRFAPDCLQQIDDASTLTSREKKEMIIG